MGLTSFFSFEKTIYNPGWASFQGEVIKRLGISTSYWNYNSFGGHFLLKATWNYGKVECWNTGYEKRKTPFYSN
jgi:hypothetical protein